MVAVDVRAEVIVVEFVVLDMVVVVAVVFGIKAIGTNRIAIRTRLLHITFVHGVLKRLQYPFSKKEML